MGSRETEVKGPGNISHVSINRDLVKLDKVARRTNVRARCNDVQE